MTFASEDPLLSNRLADAVAEAGQPLSREQVAEIISEIVGTMEGDITALDLKVYQELQSLAGYIEAARAEIASIRPSELRDEYISSATDELDAVVDATEDATGRILDAAEQIQTIAEDVAEPAQTKLIELVTGIFEASNFQDITGQRISKVVRALKHIESKIGVLVSALGEEVQRAREQAADSSGETAAKQNDKELLNGPQMPDNAIDQDEIDRLMESFD